MVVKYEPAINILPEIAWPKVEANHPLLRQDRSVHAKRVILTSEGNDQINIDCAGWPLYTVHPPCNSSHNDT